MVFDVGGVLEYTPRTGWQTRWARRLGMCEAEFDRRLDALWSRGSLGSVDLAEVERATGIALGISDDGVAALMGDAWSEYLGSLNVELTTYFASLRPRFRTGILSNSFVGAREREQAAYGFADLCDAVVYSHEEGVAKPDPAFFAVVCDRLGVGPAETVFLDDVAGHVDAARALGMTAIQFQDNARALRELRAVLA